MRRISPAAQAIREQRGHLIEIPMVWFSSRDRDTGVVTGTGLWQGEDVEAIAAVDLFTGVVMTRTFHPSALLDLGAVRYEVGLDYRPRSIRLSGIAAPVLVAFREHEARGAEVQAWRRSYDTNWRPIAVEPWFKGYVNAAPTDRPAAGGEAAMNVDVVSTAHTLAFTSAAKKSNEAQKRRMGDGFRRHKGTIANRVVPWGEKDVRQTGGGS